MLVGERARDRTRVTHHRKSGRGGPSDGEPYRAIQRSTSEGGGESLRHGEREMRRMPSPVAVAGRAWRGCRRRPLAAGAGPPVRGFPAATRGIYMHIVRAMPRQRICRKWPECHTLHESVVRTLSSCSSFSFGSRSGCGMKACGGQLLSHNSRT